MREFKFRAWDTEKQEMATVNFIGLNDYEVGMEDEECRRWRATYPYVCRLMQYTNLKDKNGKEIYEGDILHLYGEDTINTYDWMAVVEFGNPNGSYSWGVQLRPITNFEYNHDILVWIGMEESGIYAEICGNTFEKE